MLRPVLDDPQHGGRVGSSVASLARFRPPTDRVDGGTPIRTSHRSAAVAVASVFDNPLPAETADSCSPTTTASKASPPAPEMSPRVGVIDSSGGRVGGKPRGRRQLQRGSLSGGRSSVYGKDVHGKENGKENGKEAAAKDRGGGKPNLLDKATSRGGQCDLVTPRSDGVTPSDVSSPEGTVQSRQISRRKPLQGRSLNSSRQPVLQVRLEGAVEPSAD